MIFNKSHIIFSFTLIYISVFSGVLQAEDADISGICERQSMFTAAKIRENMANELTERDIQMIQLGAVNACKDTYRRLSNPGNLMDAEDASASASGQNVSSTAESINKNDKNDSEGSSILERLLNTESKEPVNPMQKRHRTGGK